MKPNLPTYLPTCRNGRLSAGVRAIAVGCALLLGSADRANAQIHLTEVLADLHLPVFVTSWPDNPNALVVVERGSAKISTFIIPQLPNLPVVQQVLIDLSAKAYLPTVEWYGVTGFAFHPDFLDDRTRRFIYVRYNSNVPNQPWTRIERYRVPPGTVTADLSTATLLYSYPNTDSPHGTGQIHFDNAGTDPSVRLLYFGMADDADPTDTCAEKEVAQDDQSELGKMWVMNVQDANPPAVPPLTTLAKGLRNPFAFSVDRGDSVGQGLGDLWIGNTGQDCTGDIFVYPYGASGVRNYAWPWMVGNCALFDGDPPDWTTTGCPEPPNPPTYTLPTRVVSHQVSNDANDALLGGYAYRAASVEEFTDPAQYVYGLFGVASHPRVLSIDADDPTNDPVTADWSTCLGLLSWGTNELHGLGQDSEGELYLIRVEGTGPNQGTIYRIDG